MSIAGFMRACSANTTLSWLRSASTADCMSGYCSLPASAAPSCATARCTWPSEAEAADCGSKLWKRAAQSGPSSAIMRRRTNAGPIGGACDCSWASSSAYSAGSASGMVAISCATFMIGPLRPPSAAASAAAFLAVVGIEAEQALARDPRRHRTDVGADLDVARRPRG